MEAAVCWAACIFYVCVCIAGDPIDGENIYTLVRPEVFMTFCSTAFILLGATSRKPNASEPSVTPAPAMPTAPSLPGEDPADAQGACGAPKKAGRSGRKREGRAVSMQACFDALHRRLAVLRLSEAEPAERATATQQGDEAVLACAEAVLYSLHDDMERPDSQAGSPPRPASLRGACPQRAEPASR